MIDTSSGAARLLDFLPDKTLPSATLLELTADEAKARTSSLRSGLEKRVAEAWLIPMSELNCGQCRMLIGQRLGMPWLAGPVATFVTRYPRAECDLYPGDLTVVALIEWQEMARAAPEETAAMLAADFDWLKREAMAEQWDGSIVKTAVAALDEARQR